VLLTPVAVREVATQSKIPLIDLGADSMRLLREAGEHAHRAEWRADLRLIEKETS
jgi:hypothetical protein